MMQLIKTKLNELHARRKLAKKGFFNQITALATGIASLVVIFAVTFVLIAQVKANSVVVADGNATAAVNTLQQAAGTIPGWIGLIVLVAIGAILISLVALFSRNS